MDRPSFKIPFTEKRFPDWFCPTCQKGLLLPQKNTFFKEELAESKMGRNHDAWEPDWIKYTYSCLLKCSNDKCKEVVANVGDGSVTSSIEEDEEGYLDQVFGEYFSARYFNPHLKLIRIPAKCPESVTNVLNESFKLFFCSPSSASNQVRIAVEELLTDLKVKRYETAKGKKRYISLHRRINLIPKKYEDLKELLFAIKWLGNDGSHSRSGIKIDDVMDAYDLIEHVLSEIYEAKTKKLKAKAKKVIKKKGA
jgi:hypothetical protein